MYITRDQLHLAALLVHEVRLNCSSEEHGSGKGMTLGAINHGGGEDAWDFGGGKPHLIHFVVGSRMLMPAYNQRKEQNHKSLRSLDLRVEGDCERGDCQCARIAQRALTLLENQLYLQVAAVGRQTHTHLV